ncbi:MAG: MarR family winged helix-turn-helix transcriptional regulator [Acidobacteriota bacterium]|jgi:DNA-binding MarR family transcriptional regulator
MSDPVVSFMQMLWGVEESLQQMSRRMQSQLGVTGPQRMVLKLVAAQEGIAANDLAKQIHLHPSTVSGIVRRLEANGMLARVADKEDGRRYKLKLKAAGRKVVEKKTGTVEAAVRTLMEQAPERDLTVVRKTMEKLRGILQEQMD